MPKFTVKVSEREADWPDDESLIALQCSPKEGSAPSLADFPKRDRGPDPAARGAGGQEAESPLLSPLHDPRGHP
jgi:hypothetical protein